MIAYSDQKDYVEGDFVHVLVPLGDYTQKKIILGKVKATEEVVTDIRPFERFAPVTENLNTRYDTASDEFTFVVNKDYEKIIFNKVFADPKKYLGYNRLGIKLSIAASLKSLTQEVISGKYRIRIQLKGIDLTKQTSLDFNNNSAVVTRPYEYIEMEDMVFINPYNTFGYCNQEKVFNIENFALQSIVISVLQQKGEEDAFKDLENVPVSGETFSIKFKNIYCSLGYECDNKDINTEKLYVYPIDGLRYDFSSSAYKKVNARLVKFRRDSRFMPYGEIIDMDSHKMYNGWGTYILDSTNVDENFGIPGYIYIDGSNEKKNGVFELPINTNKGLIENRFIFSIDRDGGIKLSNSLIFLNNDYVKNADLLDNIVGFTGFLSDNRESFNIYGLDNKLLNDYNENETYYLIVSYNSINGRKIEEGDTITWKFPAEKTMLVPVSSYDYEPLEDGSFSVEIKPKHSLYRADKTFQIPFKIKNIYNQNFINNTITCSFSFIDENQYLQNLEFSKSITFGFSGSEGSEYIYNLELYRKEPNGQIIKIQSIPNLENDFQKYAIELKAYDYNMDQADFAQAPQYKWLTDEVYTDINPDNMSNFLSRFKDLDPVDRIIMARHAVINNADLKEYLITYLPIGSLLTNTEYNLEGCKTISYDYSGTKPYYYKGEYKLYKRNSTSAEKDIYFQREFPSGLTIGEDAVQIINGKVKPYDVYIEGLTHFGVRAIYNIHDDNREDLLIFPVVIIQGQYSAMTEYVKTPIKINDNDSIEKPILGYISTNKDGIMIGKRISSNTGIKDSTIGFYGYKNGIQLFGFDETNGLIADGLEDNLITLRNGNLYNFSLTDCTITKLTDNKGADLNVGSVTKPVYFLNGVPTVCNTMATSSDIQSLNNQISQLKEQIANLQRQINDLS